MKNKIYIVYAIVTDLRYSGYNQAFEDYDDAFKYLLKSKNEAGVDFRLISVDVQKKMTP